MKIVFGLLFIASTSMVACGGAPTEGEGSAGSSVATGETPATQVEGPKGEVKGSPKNAFGACTAAERDECIAESPGHFHASCLIEDGKPVCIIQ